MAEENRPVAGFTISREILEGAVCFSLANGTDISAETYPHRKLVLVLDGELEVYGIQGDVFSLKELVPYRDGSIVNMDVVRNERMKLVVMSFCKGTALGEHSAPGEAIVFALEGEGLIGYEGREHRIKAGESFRFAKGGLHSVRATENFKMALLLALEGQGNEGVC